MYRRQRNQTTIEDFKLPFGGKLNADNQWVKLAELMPWNEIDKKYRECFKQKGNYGQVPIDSRVVFGSTADVKSENKGVLMLDATCAPSDVTYPTDIFRFLYQIFLSLIFIIYPYYTLCAQPRSSVDFRTGI